MSAEPPEEPSFPGGFVVWKTGERTDKYWGGDVFQDGAFSERRRSKTEERQVMTMRCRRCDGLMFPMLVGTHEGITWARQCVTCGDVMDPVILQNRLAGLAGGTRSPRRNARPHLRLVRPKRMK